MKNSQEGSGFAVCLVFFVLALVSALEWHNWMQVLFWTSIGLLFVAMDLEKKRE